MSKSIRLSEKHGVNPTIPVCFWCGEEKNEIALLGKLPKDQEAPRSMWIAGDYEPCEKCKKRRELGIDFIEALEQPALGENQPPYYGYFPTGRHVVLKEEAARRIFGDLGNIEQIIEARFTFIDRDAMNWLFDMINDSLSE